MPRLNLPIRGGAHPQRSYGPDAAECPVCAERMAEVERLKQELAHAREGLSDGSGRRSIGGSTMMWMALMLCGLGLAFAVIAVLRHG
jgi:hypothetical protein